MVFKSLNIDELIFRVHTYFFEPIWNIITLKWIFNSQSAKLYEEANQLGVAESSGFFDKFFGSGFFRIFNSRPSTRKDSVEELVNPSEDRGFFESVFDLFFGRSDKEGIFELLFTTAFGWLVLLGLLAAGIYFFLKTKSSFLSEKEKIIYDIAHTKEEKKVADNKATRWQSILDKVNSDLEPNWKIAVMDADILLDEVLQEQGYVGSGVGERLKQVGPEFKDSISYAWEAHKVRNQVAHDAQFALSQREARKTISMYERFFSAFYHT